jgi:hypothetical protein
VGTWADALWAAAAANQEHDKVGRRRTNLDKRRAVTLALRARPQASNRAIAKQVRVSHTHVNNVKQEIAEEERDEAEFQARCGGNVSTSAPEVKARREQLLSDPWQTPKSMREFLKTTADDERETTHEEYSKRFKHRDLGEFLEGMQSRFRGLMRDMGQTLLALPALEDQSRRDDMAEVIVEFRKTLDRFEAAIREAPGDGRPALPIGTTLQLPGPED